MMLCSDTSIGVRFGRFGRSARLALCLLAGLALLAVSPSTVRAQSILISSNSGSAIAALYTNQSYSYNFGITTLGGNQSLLLTNIGIYMDRGNNTTQPFRVEIYGGLGGSGPLITNFTVAATNISASMSLFNLLFTNSISLSNGNYSLTLSSAASSGGSTQYSLRQGTLALLDSNNAPLPLTYWVQDNNTSGTAGTNFQANFVLANYQITTNNINYGNYRLGTTLSTAVTLTNNAIYATNSTNGLVTERLTTATATTNAATVSGLSTNLVSVNQTTNFTVGMSSANVGTNSGVVTLTYNSVSNGTASTRPASLGTNPVGIGSQTINVTGVGYRLATNAVSTTNVAFGNFRIGATTNFSTNVAVTNTAANDGYSEGLGVTNGGTTGGASVANLPGGLITASANSNVTVGLAGLTNAGTNSGTVTLGFNSSGVGTSGFAATNIGTQAINVSAVGYRLAADAISTTNVSLGRFHIGYTTNNGSLSGTVGITNTATADAYSEGLAVANNGTSGGASVSGIPAGLVAAGANTSISVGLGSVSSVGTNSGSVTLGFQSSGVGTSGFAATNIGSKIVNVIAQGYSGQAIWNTDAAGSWNNFDNWDAPGGTPGIDGVLSTNDTATFGNAISTARTVSLNGQSPVLTSLSFSNASASYTVAQGTGGSITMGTPSASQTTITNAAGAHTISAAISLARATQVGVATNSKLSVSTVNGSQNLSKSGSGTLSITGAGDLSGSTTVTGGTLNVNGSISNSTVTMSTGAVLSGSGTVGETTIANGATISPGNSPGTLNINGDLNWSSGGNYDWQIYNAAGPAGTGWDLINISGVLDLSALSAENKFNINMWSLVSLGPDVNGDALNFNNLQSYTWTIATAAGGITNFSATYFNLFETSNNGAGGFSNDKGGGLFTLETQGNNLNIVFTPGGGPQPVPEPGTWAAAALLAAGAVFMRWRKRAKVS